MADKIRILTVIDPHASDRNPGARLGNYLEDFIEKHKQIQKISKDKNIDYIIYTGDLFSDKKSRNNSHTLTSTFIELLRDMPVPVYGILGNHDLFQNRFDSWPDQPSSNLIKSKVYTLLDEHPIEMTFDNGKKLKIRGRSYDESENVNALFEGDSADLDYLVHVSHFAVNPEGGTYSKYSEKMWSYEEISTAPPNMFILGHIHNDYGITKDFGKVFIQHGSLMRSTTHCYNLDRDIKVGIIEIDQDLNESCEEVCLNVKKSSDVFSLKLKARQEKETERVEQFFEKLNSTNSEDSEKTTFKCLVENLGDDYDKESLTKLYRHYMDEAEKSVK